MIPPGIKTTHTNNYEARGPFMPFLMLAITAVMGIGGVCYNQLLDKVNKQELQASADIANLREEIKTTKADAKDAVNNAAVASNAAVAATASALKDAVAATALAAKDSVQASAAALRESVTASSKASNDAVAATASALTKQIDQLFVRLDRIESTDAVARAQYQRGVNDTVEAKKP